MRALRETLFIGQTYIDVTFRLAMAILLYTSWRREDAVSLGPQHVRSGRIKYRQAKNEHRNPVDMAWPTRSERFRR
jgi:hypothetical protein